MMLGCTPGGRNTEQHDVYFTVAPHIRDTIPEIIKFWPEAKGDIHIDAWREVTQVDNFSVEVQLRDSMMISSDIDQQKLFFVNLGGYKENEFDEFHYKMIVAASDKGSAIMQAKNSAFYKHTRFKGAESHIDDKFGVDVDDIYQIEDILPPAVKTKYQIRLKLNESKDLDKLNLGYFKLDSL